MADARYIALLPVELSNRNDGQGHHWARTAKAKTCLKVALASFRKAKPFPCRVDVVFTRVLGPRQRLWDPDSVGRGSAKQIVDVLTDLGWWIDDSAKHIRHFDYRQDTTRRGEGPAVHIEVFYLNEEVK